MALRSVNNDSSMGEPCEQLPACPVCDGKMEKVYDRYHELVCVCIDCHSGLTIPASARKLAMLKRERSA
jgi:hypothetical protein